MSNILIQPQQLRQIAEQLRSHAQKIDQALHAIDNDIHSLKGHQFLGHRADQVQAHYAPKRDALLSAKQLVLHFSEELMQAASAFEQADRGGGPPSVGVPTPPITPRPPIMPDPPVYSTMMVGEEGQQTIARGEEGIAVTMAMPESGEMPILWPPRDIPPIEFPIRTMAFVYWETSLAPPPVIIEIPFPIPPVVSLVVGEDGHYPFPWTPIDRPTMPRPIPGVGLISNTQFPEFPEDVLGALRTIIADVI